MTEIWDVYDINRKKTGKICKRGIDKLEEGEYHIVVLAVIINSKNEIFISKRSAIKELYPLMWECNGGSILSGETSIEGIIREIKEEIGIQLNEKDAKLLKQVVIKGNRPKIKDIWLFRKDFNIEDLQFIDGEVIDAKWVTIDEFIEMIENKKIVPSLDFDINDYNKSLELIKIGGNK